MTYVHRCPFCGWERQAASETILDPACNRCGGALRAVHTDDIDRVRGEDQGGPVRSGTRSDGTAVFALLVTTPWALPLLGVELGDVAFLVPLVLLAFAFARLQARTVTEPGYAPVWRTLALSVSLAAAASGLMVGAAIVTGDIGRAGFYLGAGASLLLVMAAAAQARRGLAGAPTTRVLDAALLALIFGGLGAWLLVVRAADGGDVALTAIVVLDLAAVMLFALGAASSGPIRRAPGAWWIAAGTIAITVGDGLIAGAAAGVLPNLPSLTAALWAAAGFAFATAADLGLTPAAGQARTPRTIGRAWIAGRIVLPLSAVLAFPGAAVALLALGELPAAGGVYFASLTLVALLLAFTRQAYLLVERQRAVVRERRIREVATRRNEELEALTGLATTMTQTLEEGPIVEQALGVLKTAARASSAALHLLDGDRLRLAASSGQWHAEHPWVDRSPAPVAEAVVERRGKRAILRVPLSARGRRIGAVTLLRPEAEPFDPHAVELLRLLVDQMGVAVQNARDYREKLEQAIRDPLTGLYNRRFLLEALEKEVQRSARYGSEASLVIFDVDDFKLVNDRFGHASGDDVLRAVGRLAEAHIRPADSFARIGGEEFALLLPETSQLEALLVAERVRTAIGREKILGDRKITVSGGIASCPSDAGEAEELQRLADGALYFAKRNGKDLCAVASEVTATDGGEAAATEGMVAHLYALVAMIDAQQLHTRDHSENVAAYTVAIAQALGLGRDRVVKLRRAAMLHDVGKIAVPSAVLSKPGRLTEDEFAQIREHPVVGGLMLSHAGLIEEARWIRGHHERVDGAGYPDGLKRSQIPLESRILFVADAFEAMTSDRPYQDGMPVEEALAELRRCAGTQFDARVVTVLSELVRSGRLSVLALRSQ
ncbi:MAG TPA: diguanylate cyclase [Solirubrobacteraceae bacterium]|nr:diguanylate cyclase [Solirubrobacteraceae bacterium]